MATWIAHLRLAEDLLQMIPNLDPAQFAMGNIAPDSGVPDEKWEHFDPPKEVTHFLRHSMSESDIYDLEFYQKYLAHVDPQDVVSFSLRFGYFVHLLADRLWSLEVGTKLKAKFPDELKNDPGFIWQVKDDWYGLDFIYLRDHPDSLFWRVFLPAQPDDFDLDFIPKPALLHQFNYIKTLYQRRDEEIQEMYKRPYIYLSQAEMDAFVSDSAQLIYKVYQSLWPTPPDLAGKNSALEMI